MTLLEYETTKIKIERENEEKLKHYPILEKQLKIAEKYLKKLTHKEDWRLAREALQQIKELKQDD